MKQKPGHALKSAVGFREEVAVYKCNTRGSASTVRNDYSSGKIRNIFNA